MNVCILKKAFSLSVLMTVGWGNIWAHTLETDPMVKILQEELRINMEQLKSKPVPSYFMSYRVVDEKLLSFYSQMGVCNVNPSHASSLTPTVRLGNMELDNYMYNNQNGGTQGSLASVPLQIQPTDAMRKTIWTASMKRYDTAVSMYQDALSKSKTDVRREDQAANFSESPAERYYEDELPEWLIDTLAWKNKLNRISSVFKECRLLDYGTASCDFLTQRNYVVNTDGTAVVHNRRCISMTLAASIKAPDGMECPLHVNYFGYKEEDLPSEEELIAQAKDFVNRLLALREAPLADPFSGPAILTSDAAGVFFHEIFGHRLESHRLKIDGQTFKKCVGQQVLPLTFAMYDDPTIRYYNNVALNGSYTFDDEGVRAQRVDCVKEGILVDFLSSRIPADGFPRSNGHGRANNGFDPVARQSNLVLESSKTYTEGELRQMLVDEAKKQGKEYGYLFRTASGGQTNMFSFNSFNVNPLEVYRIYVDGRKDELVRGVDLIGTPLTMFSQIKAASDQPHVYIGYCGAESGWIPVTATSPSVFVATIETQRSPEKKILSEVLPLPAYTTSAQQDVQDIIFSAMQDEMKRSLDSLQIEGSTLPYMADYRIMHSAVCRVGASLGCLTHQDYNPSIVEALTHMGLGDKMLTSQLEEGHRGDFYFICQTPDYDAIRKSLWRKSDGIYKTCVSHLGQKINRLKKKPLPEDDRDIPELLEMPAVEHIAPSVHTSELDTALLTQVTRELSDIFRQYPQIGTSSVRTYALLSDLYRFNSEGIKLRVPLIVTFIDVRATIKSADGCELNDSYSLVVRNVEDLPALESMKKEIVEFCDLLIQKSQAPVVKEYYVGPIMLEDEAVNEAIHGNLVMSIGVAKRNMYSGSRQNSMMLGKRVVDTNMNITQLTDIPSYHGVKLIANYTIDADGTAPDKELKIVENGILKNLLCGRRPSLGAEKSTGNELLQIGQAYSAAAPGVIRVTFNKSVASNKMRSCLIKEAKKAGLDHAYIVKAPKNGKRYLVRLDIATGKEEIVRTNNIPVPSKADFMHVTAASKEEFIANKRDSHALSYITPKSIVIENVSYSFAKPTLTQEYQLADPATR